MFQKIWDSFWIDHHGFKIFSAEHFFIIVSTILLCYLLIKYGKKQSTEEAKMRIALHMSWLIFFAEALWIFHKWQTNSLDNTILPFDLCNFIALIIPFVMKKGSKIILQALYFLVLTGTTQGILTPDLQSAFPYIGYVKFWIIHIGLVILVLYNVFVFQIYPTFKGVLWGFVAINAYALCVYPINLMLNTNFGYIMHKPEGGSVLDFLGDNYVLKLEPIFFTAFIIFWLPFVFRKQKTLQVSLDK